MNQTSPGMNTDSMYQEVRQISDLYQTKLRQAANFRRMASEEDCTALMRGHFKDRAFDLESQATNLAHCLALFGDGSVASIDFEKYLSAVKEMTCEERNPWARGLAMIREEMTALVKP